MKPPAFQLYADDLIAGTIKFSDAELGLYIRLLCAQWSEGSLPDDDEELSSYGRGKTPLARVKAKFEKTDGRLRNARMEQVRTEQNEFRAARREAGKKGNEIRWGAHRIAIAQASPSDPTAIANPIAKHRPPSPSPLSNKTTKLPASPQSAFSQKQTDLTARYHAALGEQWENDRQKWMGRIKNFFDKAERVIAEVENAAKEGRIKKGPAEYAQHTWDTFQ